MGAGNLDFGGVGARGELGTAMGRVQLLAELSVLGVAISGQDVVSDEEVMSGVFLRIGATARYPVGRWTLENGTVAGWVEGGVGWHRLPSTEPIKRMDGLFGYLVEMQMKKWGFLLGTRFLIAQPAPMSRDLVRAVELGASEPNAGLDVGSW